MGISSFQPAIFYRILPNIEALGECLANNLGLQDKGRATNMITYVLIHIVIYDPKN